MKKVILTLAVIAGTLSLAIAGTPKGETKDAKTETPSESVSKAKSNFTYYVTGQSTDHTMYLLSNSPAPGCGSGLNPCQIDSEEELPAAVPKSDVDDNDKVQIITRRASL